MKIYSNLKLEIQVMDIGAAYMNEITIYKKLLMKILRILNTF